MRAGWSCKAGAVVLGVSETKFPAAIDHALVKVAKLMLADPLLTWRDLMAAMNQLERERLDELEIERRTRMADNRFPRRVVFPAAK